MRRYQNEPLLSPSDLNDLLECRHLMALKLAAFEGKDGPRPSHGAHTEILVRYGEQHEQAILEAFERDGRSVERIQTGRTEEELRRAVAKTTEAMRKGIEVIHQAALVGGGVGGYADFLERIDLPSELGAWSYGVADAKLARTTKTYFLVQLSAYAALIERLQGEPAELTVLLGDGRHDSYRSADFAAYVRAVLRHAKQTISQGLAETYPLPCSHCAICGYRRACEQRRLDDDHLSLVAGLRRDQVARLERAGVTTLTALAQLPEHPRCRASHATPDTSSGHRRRSSCTSAPPASRSTSCCPTSPATGSACSPSRRRATCSSTSRATPTSATRGSSTCSGSAGWTSTEPSGSNRSGPTTAMRSDARSRRWSTSHRVALAAPRQPHLPLRPIRGAGAEDARHVPRHPRGRDR